MAKPKEVKRTTLPAVGALGIAVENPVNDAATAEDARRQLMTMELLDAELDAELKELREAQNVLREKLAYYESLEAVL